MVLINTVEGCPSIVSIWKGFQKSLLTQDTAVFDNHCDDGCDDDDDDDDDVFLDLP